MMAAKVEPEVSSVGAEPAVQSPWRLQKPQTTYELVDGLIKFPVLY